MDTLVCQLSTSRSGVSAAVTRVVDGRLNINHGTGDCVCDAISSALRMKSLVFATQDDELTSCVAAMRNKSVKIRVSGRSVRSQAIL